jgi:cell division protein FtsN
MARKDPRAARRDEAPPRKKGGGMFAGLLIGLVIGLVIAAGLAWYFKLGASAIKPVDSARPEQKRPPARSVQPPIEPPPAAEPAKPKTLSATEAEARKTPPPPETPAPAVKPRVDYTFYGILPGDKPVKPIEPPKSRETWWLQVAALKSPADADKLKARLALLGLEVSTQKVDSAGQALYRVRVGPYKREDDALGDLDTLSQNNFEPRLLKEPLKP